MHIESIIRQNRRDFKAIFSCEHCGYKETKTGYDDAYYQNVVVPGMKCANCGKAAGENFIPRATQYPEGFQV